MVAAKLAKKCSRPGKWQDVQKPADGSHPADRSACDPLTVERLWLGEIMFFDITRRLQTSWGDGLMEACGEGTVDRGSPEA